jgi:hypothetical protein
MKVPRVAIRLPPTLNHWAFLQAPATNPVTTNTTSGQRTARNRTRRTLNSERVSVDTAIAPSEFSRRTLYRRKSWPDRKRASPFMVRFSAPTTWADLEWPHLRRPLTLDWAAHLLFRSQSSALLMWVLADVVGLFSIKVGSFSRNVGRSARIFSANVGQKPRMLSGPAVYVCGPLHDKLESFLCRRSTAISIGMLV